MNCPGLATTSITTSTSVPIGVSTCTCTVSDALHWVVVISEDAYVDVDLRRLLPLAIDHFDAIVERDAA